MIHSWAYDVEIFPNLFSVTFVNLKHYMEVFSDCINNKGKPIALTEKLSVSEIKSRLDTIDYKIFKISDSDDSQLLELAAFINKMQAHFETVNKDGTIHQIPHRTDLYGFNSLAYDDLMIRGFMMRFNRYNTAKALIKYLYNLSKKIIDLQSDKNSFYGDKDLETLRSYKLPYASIDVQQVYGLHSASVIVDKEGIRNKFPKSLKQTSINLKWHELLDFKLPPIDEEEYNIYWNHLDSYRGMGKDYVNALITNDFDRYILPKYEEPMLHYNKNDVFIVCEMVRQKPDEVKLRYSITSAFDINVLSSARANIADKLTIKFYSDMSGLRKEQFIKGRTERTKLSFNKIIFPHISFKTPELRALLEEMKTVSVYHTTKSDFCKEITFYGTTYTLACGGIHTKDIPIVLESNKDFIYKHFDYNSYYPSIIISYNISPKHLNNKIFVDMVKYFRDTRVKCKHTKDEEGYIINGVPNKIAAEALKIVINSIYGKFGSELSFLYDRFAQLQVTINGQLMTMSLVEELELNGIHVISANTDGIIIKLPRNKIDIFNDITKRWNETNKMGADSEDYKAYYGKDVNNYFAVWPDEEVDAKGALDPKQYLKDLKKGYDMPIVAKAVFNYLYKKIPVMDTLQNCTDILDFCKTQNVGRQFEIVYETIENGKVKTIHSQRHVRFYVSTKGVIIQKEEINTGKRSKLASGLPSIILNSLDDKPIEERNINYEYYLNEAYKIINPIKLGISPNQKADKLKGTVSGKNLIKKYDRDYLVLFDEETF
jgi:hypothetical protein